jgi:Dual specificity phosphatase, catalytic domain
MSSSSDSDSDQAGPSTDQTETETGTGTKTSTVNTANPVNLPTSTTSPASLGSSQFPSFGFKSPASSISGQFPAPPRKLPPSKGFLHSLANLPPRGTPLRCVSVTPTSSGTFSNQSSGTNFSGSFASPSTSSAPGFPSAVTVTATTAAAVAAAATSNVSDPEQGGVSNSSFRSEPFVIFDANQICGLDEQQTPLNLFVGSEFAVQSADYLKKKGITHVLTAAREVELPDEVTTSFKYKKLQTRDRVQQPDFPSEMNEAYTFYRQCCKENGVLIVHCAKGKSRSVAFVIGILMIEEARTNPYFLLDFGMSNESLYNEKLAQVQKTRTEADPFWDFITELHELEKRLVDQKRQEANIIFESEIDALDDDEYYKKLDFTTIDKRYIISYITNINNRWPTEE